jgi:gamma-glutamylcyclotransferase (GGCT)/AIG2-like uncharacterized protein YtfP
MPHTATHSRQSTSKPSGLTDRLSVGPEALFVYGSLLFPQVLEALLGRSPELTAAAAAGWRVAALTGRQYPGLLPSDRHAIGILITDLTPDEWRVLDAFEDDVYELRRLALTDTRHAWAYVCPDDREALTDDWDAERFAAEHLASYVKVCAAWRRRYDAAAG